MKIWTLVSANNQNNRTQIKNKSSRTKSLKKKSLLRKTNKVSSKPSRCLKNSKTIMMMIKMNRTKSLKRRNSKMSSTILVKTETNTWKSPREKANSSKRPERFENPTKNSSLKAGKVGADIWDVFDSIRYHSCFSP